MNTQVKDKRTGEVKTFDTREEADNYISQHYEDPNFYGGQLDEVVVRPKRSALSNFYNNSGLDNLFGNTRVQGVRNAWKRNPEGMQRWTDAQTTAAGIVTAPIAATTAIETSPTWGPWVVEKAVPFVTKHFLLPTAAGMIVDEAERAVTGTTATEQLSSYLQNKKGWNPYVADFAGGFVNPGYWINFGGTGRYTGPLFNKIGLGLPNPAAPIELSPTIQANINASMPKSKFQTKVVEPVTNFYNTTRNAMIPAIIGTRMRIMPLGKIQTTQIPLNVGWGPRQTISVTHKSDQAFPLSLYNEQRWDVLNEGANPFGIWFQGKLGIPRTTNTGATPIKAEKALKARQLFSRRPYTHSRDLTLDKPLVTIGDVPNRSALSYQAEQLGADGLIYNNVYDNGYDANQVLLSFRHPDNYMLTARAYKGGPEISNVPTIDIRQSLVNQYNTNKYIRLLGKAKDSDQFKGSIEDRSIVTRPFAEYLEKLGINSSLFTEKDLNTLIQMRSKLVQRTIPQTGRSAISYEMKPKNQQTVFSIDINENGTTLGEISARSHNPNHPRANEVPIDMVSRVEVSPSRGLSEDAYNAAIDYVKQTGIGEGLVSGERLLSPEITYNVWKHYPNRQLLRTNGHHTFGTGRDVVGQPVSETHKGPVVMLTEPSKTPLPMKSNSIFHPDMIKDGKLLPPDWTKYGIYYSLPLLLGTYGMFTNKKAN